MKWQTMDSAPRDGSEFLGYFPEYKDISYEPRKIEIWRWKDNPRVGRGWFSHTTEQDDYDLEDNPPTHWMPLPDAPL